MKPHTRRSIAYIVGRLISGKSTSYIYDYLESKYFCFGGNVSMGDVSIYDYELRRHISGNGSNGSFSLYHYGNNRHIQLTLDGAHFNGYDYDVGKHFSGNVSENSISLYDYEHSKYFNYSI